MKNLATVLVGLSMSSMAFAAPTIHVNCYEKVEHGHDAGIHHLYSGMMPLGKLKLESKADKSNHKVYFLDFSANCMSGPDLVVVQPEPVAVSAPSCGQSQGQSQSQDQSKDHSQGKETCQSPAPIEEVIPGQCIEVPGTEPASKQEQGQCQAGQSQGTITQCQDQGKDQGQIQGGCDKEPVQQIDTAKINLFSHHTGVDFAHQNGGTLTAGQSKTFTITHHRGLLGFEVHTSCKVTYMGQ